MCSACRRRDGTTLQAGITRTTRRGCRFARGSIVFPLLCRAKASRDRHGSPNAPTRRRGARGGGSGEAVASAPEEIHNILQLVYVLALPLKPPQVPFECGCGEEVKRHQSLARTSRKDR